MSPSSQIPMNWHKSVNQCLSVDYGVRTNSLLVATRDGASVNQAALGRIAFIFPTVLNVVCLSHTIDNIGNHLVVPTLLKFGSFWIRLFCHSYNAKLCPVSVQCPRPLAVPVESLRAFSFLRCQCQRYYYQWYQSKAPCLLPKTSFSKLKRNKSNGGMITRNSFLIGLQQWSKFIWCNHLLQQREYSRYVNYRSTSNRNMS